MKRLNCVLIVDDDRVSNYVTENVLRGMGVSSMINTVTDGQAGLEYIIHQCSDSDFACPELIFLDFNMRLVNGIEFVRDYNKLKLDTPSFIVILSTLPLLDRDRIELEKLGVSHFYTKPLNVQKLNEIMERYSLMHNWATRQL